MRAVTRVVGTAMWYSAIAMMYLLLAIVFMRVVTRYLFDFTYAWSQELSQFLAIWLSLLVVGKLLMEDSHLGVDLLFEKLSTEWQYRIRSVQLGLIFVLAVFVTEYGLVYALNSGLGQTSPTLGIEMFYPYLIMPIFGLLLALHSLSKFLEITVDREAIDSVSRAEKVEEVAE
ncbi:TRAP transporter small permease [Halovivax limisalsi]|uniref:TRAP transporter small permease n=1 Tax=Halovivax limisalsi TaxID=1453760 RepID=UPI001FFD5F53|nr:TRAP transporter small permease [Halovivax limisalsi]